MLSSICFREDRGALRAAICAGVAPRRIVVRGPPAREGLRLSAPAPFLTLRGPPARETLPVERLPGVCGLLATGGLPALVLPDDVFFCLALTAFSASFAGDAVEPDTMAEGDAGAETVSVRRALRLTST